MKKKKRPKTRKIPEVLTAQEQGMLLAEMSSNGPRRNYIMALVMMGCGLRLAETISLEVGDLDWESGTLRVRNGKGGKQRILWMPSQDRWAIKEFAQIRPQGPLFISKIHRPLSVRYVRYMLLAAGERAGITKRVHPHMLRHTFAMNLLQKTKSIFLVMKALGHSHISTTQIYLHLVDGELEEAMKNMRNGHAPAPH